ncbi:hypothetical protein Bca4012_087045 [Brassica carinata]|uniref:Uncharacterized protein n=2 Tax=Brassica TaxID=3705 RepID=A0A0D3A3C6_BRAOL|nr:hypothetical protein HID58_040781 [Brassica napus]CAF2069021.1 unnamed protein product [Brassica napus]CDY70410.1 BnaCnng68220D [Brassica napus]
MMSLRWLVRNAGVVLFQREIPDSINIQVAKVVKRVVVPVILDVGEWIRQSRMSHWIQSTSAKAVAKCHKFLLSGELRCPSRPSTSSVTEPYKLRSTAPLTASHCTGAVRLLARSTQYVYECRTLIRSPSLLSLLLLCFASPLLSSLPVQFTPGRRVTSPPCITVYTSEPSLTPSLPSAVVSLSTVRCSSASTLPSM